MLDLVGLPVADHKISMPVQNRLHQFGGVCAVILVVPVGIYDDICAGLKAGLEAAAKGSG